MLPPTVYMVDPGGMTGIACLRSNGQFIADEFSPMAACDMIWDGAKYLGMHLTLCWERWTTTARTHKLTRQNDALEVIGVCKYAAYKFGCRTAPERQQATPSKQEQEVLKRLGWWVEGKDDAQSAAGHMLRFVLDSGFAPPAVLDAVANREMMNGKDPDRRGAGRKQPQ